MITTRFRHLPLQLRPLVDKFYRDHRSPMRSQAGDELWVAQSASEIVAPTLRRQGLAAALLSHSLALHPEPVWLFCHPELRSFYQRLGFEDCQSLPTELAVRLIRYQRNKSLVSLRIH